MYLESIPAEPMPAQLRRLLESAPDPIVGRWAAESYAERARLFFLRGPDVSARLDRARMAELINPAPTGEGIAS